MKKVVFASAAALMTVVGMSSFSSHGAASKLWFRAPENGPGKHGSITIANVAVAGDYFQTALSAKPVIGNATNECSTKANFVCAALFLTNGSGLPSTYETSFVTGQYNFAS